MFVELAKFILYETNVFVGVLVGVSLIVGVGVFVGVSVTVGVGVLVDVVVGVGVGAGVTQKPSVIVASDILVPLSTKPFISVLQLPAILAKAKQVIFELLSTTLIFD